MSDALEQELRAALAERAQTLAAPDADHWLDLVEAPAAIRFRLHKLRATVGVALAAAVLVVAIVVLMSGGLTKQSRGSASQVSVPAAFVGWTPAPTEATAKRIAVYAKRCEWAASYKSRLGSPLIADVRGPYTAILFVVRTKNYSRFCIYGPHIGLQGSSSLTSPEFSGPPGPYGIQSNRAGGSCNPATGQAVTQMQGEVGKQVTGATFLFGAHTRVVASVRQGFYLVWWPWSQLPRAVKLNTTSGNREISLFKGRVRHLC